MRSSHDESIMAACSALNVRIDDVPHSCGKCEEVRDMKTSAVKYCLDCTIWLCKTCLDAHQQFFKSHTLSDNTSSSTPSLRHCPAHKGMNVMYYCLSCKECVCPVCRLDDGAHKAHDCISISERIDAVRGEVKEAIAALKMKEDKAGEQITALNHEFSAVSARSRKLEDKVKERLQTLAEEHQQQKINSEEELLEKKKSCASEIKKLQEYLNDADAAIGLTDTSSLKDEVNSPLPKVIEFREGLHEAGLQMILGEDLTDEQKSDILKSLKPVTSTPSGLYEAGIRISLGKDLTQQQMTDVLKTVKHKITSKDVQDAPAVLDHNISLLSALNLGHRQVSSALKHWNVSLPHLTGEQTAGLIRKGSRVKRDGLGLGTARGPVGSDKRVWVDWDSGYSGSSHRMGADDVYSLTLVD